MKAELLVAFILLLECRYSHICPTLSRLPTRQCIGDNKTLGTNDDETRKESSPCKVKACSGHSAVEEVRYRVQLYRVQLA